MTAVSDADGGNFMFGQVTSYSGTTLVLDIQVTAGSGTHADWNLSLTGARGPAGTGINDEAVGFTLSGGTDPKTLTVNESGTAAILGANTFTGTQEVPAIKITTGAGAYKILTSDAAGDATWEDAAASGVSFPQNSQSADYTLVIGDAGKSIFHPSSDSTQRVYTIPANASVAFDIGAVVLFVNEQGAGNIVVSINTDTLEDLSGDTGDMFLTGGNVLTALKVTSTKWLAWSKNKTLTPYAP